jgi:hypothetical protein
MAMHAPTEANGAWTAACSRNDHITTTLLHTCFVFRYKLRLEAQGIKIDKVLTELRDNGYSVIKKVGER